jgi:hypothetical protein
MDRDEQAIDRAMRKLQAAEQRRWEAIGELKRLGAIRSRSIVGDIGEEMAKRFYGALELAPTSNRGYDLITPQGLKVQVKTLRCTPGNFRRTIGHLQEGYDLLFAIRLDADYTPREAIEAPRSVVRRYFGDGRATWTNTFGSDSSVRQISREELVGI